ncbi:Vancomycin resistance protein YoaR, contains peptidoglycan-binding and VanW domains [Actinobaculum suis]|uniref:VanW family protein n=1 Tax=Actinobaculum suis TaxID=1657 RepID=A0A1G7DPI7_9ACTO|nr:VanW family protein [Actinobaculum suis]MDY5153548.1 VanW family protein [Actinobaculum suis]SDE53417.1 Vancomycin resistance protein YoaR, contains peptidoglycan-binding and VanW domains [Actinobaculum suis]
MADFEKDGNLPHSVPENRPEAAAETRGSAAQGHIAVPAGAAAQKPTPEAGEGATAQTESLPEARPTPEVERTSETQRAPEAGRTSETENAATQKSAAETPAAETPAVVETSAVETPAAETMLLPEPQPAAAPETGPAAKPEAAMQAAAMPEVATQAAAKPEAATQKLPVVSPYASLSSEIRAQANSEATQALPVAGITPGAGGAGTAPTAAYPAAAYPVSATGSAGAPTVAYPNAAYANGGYPAPGLQGNAAPGGGARPVPASASASAPGLSSAPAPAPAPGSAPAPAPAVANAPARRLRWPWVVLTLIILLAAAYTGLAYYASGRVSQNTKVAGIEIGGLDPEAAQATLTSAFTERLNRDVTYLVDGQVYTANPASYGLQVDVPQTLRGLTEFSLDPRQVWAHFVSEHELAPVYTFDEAQLAAHTEELMASTGTPAVNATLQYEGIAPVITPSQSGAAVPADVARQALLDGPLQGQENVELVAQRSEPQITDALATQAQNELATPLVSGDVRVKVGEAQAVLQPATLAQAASFAPGEAGLQLQLDGKILGDEVRKQLPDALKPGEDARIEIVDHTTPTIIPSVDGQTIDDADLAAQVSQVGIKTVAAEREATPKVEASPASFTTEDAEKMGIKEVVAEISTPLTSDSVRTTNLRVGCQKVAGTLVKPGEKFSLLQTLGPITHANGFVDSGVVANGFNDTALGGGLSQLSTNTFNIGYLAGMEDIQHKPHSKYFERYPMGREATLWEGSIDMVWGNRTPYGAVIDSYIANGQVVTKLWSTKYFDVKTSTSAPRNYTQPTMVQDSGPGCEPQGRGGPGFTVTVARTVTDPEGTVVEDSSYNWTYQPVNGRTCD